MRDLDIEKEREARETVAENCCEVCEKELPEIEAETSIHLTFEIGGSDGEVLCRKHFDRVR